MTNPKTIQSFYGNLRLTIRALAYNRNRKHDLFFSGMSTTTSAEASAPVQVEKKEATAKYGRLAACCRCCHEKDTEHAEERWAWFVMLVLLSCSYKTNDYLHIMILHPTGGLLVLLLGPTQSMVLSGVSRFCILLRWMLFVV